jgi:hypothetical protein
MKMIVPVITAAFFTASMVNGVQQPNQEGTGKVPQALYELYSWPDAKGGEWDFSILYNTSRQKAVSEVFSRKTSLKGLNKLKGRISELAPGSKIIWLGELTTSDGHKVKGSEKLGYPPDAIVDQVKQFAAARNIEVLGPFKSSTQ